MSRKGPPLRIGIAGAGLMGQWHAVAARRAGGLVTAAIDPDPQAAARLQRRLSGARPFTGVTEALAATAIDVLHICAPPAAHVPLVRAAIDAGVHVLVEKPLAATAAETESLLLRAAEREVLLCPIHQFPFQRGVAAARAWLPGIGPLVHVQAVFCSAGASRTRLEADEIACDILPHPLSVLQALAVADLDSADWQATRAASGEWRVWGESAGVSLAIAISMNARPTVCGMDLYGAGGTVHLDFFHGFGFREPGAVSSWRKIAQPFDRSLRTLAAGGWNLAVRAARRQPAYPGLQELTAAFYRAVRGTSAPPYTAAEILQVARIRDAIVQPGRAAGVKPGIAARCTN